MSGLDEAIEAGAKAAWSHWRKNSGEFIPDWDHVDESCKESLRGDARATLEAAAPALLRAACDALGREEPVIGPGLWVWVTLPDGRMCATRASELAERLLAALTRLGRAEPKEGG